MSASTARKTAWLLLFDDPTSVWGKSIEQIKQSFTMDGAAVVDSTRSGTSGLSQAFKIDGGASGIKEIQYSPSTVDAEIKTTHIGEYYKITLKDGSKIKVVQPTDYRPTFDENGPIYDKATIYLNPQGQQVKFDPARNMWVPK